MYDDFYTALENGRIEPITFWNDKVSKWDEMTQTQFYIGLLGKIAVEEREGRYNSPMHRYAYQLANVISQQSNIQSQMQREQQAHFTDADEPQRPEILKHPEITKEFDKAIQIGLLLDYYTLNPDKKKAPKWLLACFIWGICKHYDISTKAKSGKNKGGFAADWIKFAFIKDAKGKDINLNQGWQNAKNNNYDPQKLKGFSFWECLCSELHISE